MAQSEAERAAEAELVQAIEKYLSVAGHDAGYALGTWAVLLAVDGYADDTIGRTNYPRILPEDGAGASYHSILGLVRFHELRLEREALDDD